MRAMVCACLLAVSGGTAFASGGLSCESDDAQAKIAIESGVTRGMGGPLFNFRGAVEIGDTSVAEDLGKTTLEKAHVAQYWLDGQDLRLVIYREREGDKPHGYVQITVLAQARDDEGPYDGIYELDVFDATGDLTGEGKTIKLKGQMSCFVE